MKFNICILNSLTLTHTHPHTKSLGCTKQYLKSGFRSSLLPNIWHWYCKCFGSRTLSIYLTILSGCKRGLGLSVEMRASTFYIPYIHQAPLFGALILRIFLHFGALVLMVWTSLSKIPCQYNIILSCIRPVLLWIKNETRYSKKKNRWKICTKRLITRPNNCPLKGESTEQKSSRIIKRSLIVFIKSWERKLSMALFCITQGVIN